MEQARSDQTAAGDMHVEALRHHRSFGISIGPGRSGTARRGEVPGPQHPAATRSARRHDGAVRPWKRRLSDDERSVLLSELLLRHPELVAEAEEITSTLLVVENDQELADEITARLRALRASGPVSVDTGRGRVLDVLQPYIDDLTRRKERGARRAAADIAIAVLSRAVRMPRGHRRGFAACPDGPARRGRRPRTHRVREGEATAPLVALASGRVPRVGVVRGELKPVLFEPPPRPGRCGRPSAIRGSVARGLRQFITVALKDKAVSGIREDQGMATAARDRLARTLRGDAQAAFSVELAAKTDDLSLDVEGFGRVKFPVTPAKARKLLGLGQPGPVRPWRADADRPGCPRHVGDPQAPRPRRVERRDAEGHPRDGQRRAGTAERCRADRRSSLAAGL